MQSNFKTGDEVIHVNDEYYDVLTVLRVAGETVECFEYDPRDVFCVDAKDLELL